MLAAALRLAAKAAGRNGVDFKGRAQYDAFSWLLTQADLVASGSAAGNGGQRLRGDLPSSALVPELLTTRQAAKIIGVTPRAVAKRIKAGQLPARKVGKEWAITEYDARCAAQNGRPDARPAKDEG